MQYRAQELSVNGFPERVLPQVFPFISSHKQKKLPETLSLCNQKLEDRPTTGGRRPIGRGGLRVALAYRKTGAYWWNFNESEPLTGAVTHAGAAIF